MQRRGRECCTRCYCQSSQQNLRGKLWLWALWGIPTCSLTECWCRLRNRSSCRLTQQTPPLPQPAVASPPSLLWIRSLTCRRCYPAIACDPAAAIEQRDKIKTSGSREHTLGLAGVSRCTCCTVDAVESLVIWAESQCIIVPFCACSHLIQLVAVIRAALALSSKLPAKRAAPARLEPIFRLHSARAVGHLFQ